MGFSSKLIRVWQAAAQGESLAPPRRKPAGNDGSPACDAWIRDMDSRPGVFLPLHTTTPGNNHSHWRVEGRKAKKERESTMLAIRLAGIRLALPAVVTVTRYGPRRMDEHNLPGALKHVIDGVADAFGVNDGDKRWRFKCQQEIAPYYGVRIVISAQGIEAA